MSEMRGNPRQCQHVARHSGNRCRRFAMNGSDFCQRHGGRPGISLSRKRVDIAPGSFYRRSLEPRLKELLDNAIDASGDTVQLHEELALARIAAENALKLVNAAYSKDTVSAETRASAWSLVGDSLRVVKDLALAVARIDKERATSHGVSIETCEVFIATIVRCIWKVCEREERVDLAEELEQEIEKNVRLPRRAVRVGEAGLEPVPFAEVENPVAAQVKAMDESIG